MITDFTKLTVAQIVAILEDSGYGADDIDSVEYVSCIAGQLCYEMTYEEMGETVTGNVYIYINPKGKLQAEF